MYKAYIEEVILRFNENNIPESVINMCLCDYVLSMERLQKHNLV